MRESISKREYSDVLEKLFKRSEQVYNLAKSYLEKANQLENKSEEYFERCDRNKRELNEIANVLCKEQIQAAQLLCQQVKLSHDELAKKVDQQYSIYMTVMCDLQSVFIKLREKKVESVFCRNLQNLDEKNKTDSLYDWVPTEEVHGMQKEAYSEMSAMQKLSGYLKIVGCKLEKKYEYIYKMTKMFEIVHSECSIPLAKNKLDLQKRELDTINSIYFGIVSHYDRLYYLRKSDKIIDLSGLSGTTDSLTDNLSQILDCLKRIEEVSNQVDDHSAKFEKAFTFAYRINELLDYFGIECTKKSKGFVSLEKIYSDHLNGYKHLFEQLDSLSTFYGQFIVSYNEMLFEIYRRRKQLEKQQEMVKNFQKELDIFYDREVDLREQFQRNYGDFLPTNICPALYEEQFVRRIIYPEFYETSLPEIEGAFTRTSRSLVDLALSNHFESNGDDTIDLNTSEDFLDPLT